MGICCSLEIDSYGFESYGYHEDLHLKKKYQTSQKYFSMHTLEKEIKNKPGLLDHLNNG